MRLLRPTRRGGPGLAWVGRLVGVAFACLALAGPALALAVGYGHGRVTIDTAHGPVEFSVEVADDEAAREQGLMYRQSMAPDAGMLFVFPAETPQGFWMKNTLIPLDLLFIAHDGKVVGIHERAVPLSETLIPSGAPAQYVLELNGGTVARLGLATGDAVHGPGIAGEAVPGAGAGSEAGSEAGAKAGAGH